MLRALGFLIGFGAAVASALDITTCEQTVPTFEVATLQADLSCIGPAAGVYLGHRATLELNGHVLSSDSVAFGAVKCMGWCTVNGPGGITGSGYGVVFDKRLHITGVDVHHNLIGILPNGSGSRTIARDVILRSNIGEGYFGSESVFRGVNVSVHDNGDFGLGDKVIRLVDSDVTNNAAPGIAGERVAVRGSTITGNDGLGAGVDLLAFRRPRVVDSTCGKSQQTGQPPGTTWGVCTND
jgi:hypothetical protein